MAQDRETAHDASFFLAVRETKGMSHLVDSNFCSPFKKAFGGNRFPVLASGQPVRRDHGCIAPQFRLPKHIRQNGYEQIHFGYTDNLECMIWS